MIEGYKMKVYNQLSDNGKDPEKFWLLLSFVIGFAIGTMVTFGVLK